MKIFQISFILVLTLALSGCSFGDKVSGLKWLDEKMGTFLNEENDQKKSVMEFMEEHNGKFPEEVGEEGKKNKTDAEQLTKKQKEKIDQWLEEKNLNRYGDDKSAIYTGGTPLFNEETGESINRYDYILNKFPDILEKIEK